MLDKKNKLLLDDFKSNNSTLESDEIRELKDIVNKLIYIQIDLETVSFSKKTIVFEYKNNENEDVNEITKYIALKKKNKIESYRNIMEIVDELIHQTSAKFKKNKLTKIKNILLYIMYHEDLIDIIELTDSNFQNNVLQKQIKDISWAVEYLNYMLEIKAKKIIDVEQRIRKGRGVKSSLINRKHKIFRNEILCFKSEFAPVKHKKKIVEILEIFDKILIKHHNKAV